MLIRPQSRRRSAAAIFALLLQLLLVGLVPAADARASAGDTGTAAGVHMEKPGVHHPVHDTDDCIFCTALQLGSAPAPPANAPDGGTPERVAALQPAPVTPSAPSFASPIARAPPA